jgi:CheY-like chemotaxis protein
MTLSSQHQSLIKGGEVPVADVLLVGVSPAVVRTLHPDLFSRAATGREALTMIKLWRFNLLLASLDIPDMRPWDLFHHARRTQAKLQCVLLDERLTPGDEQLVRQAGAGAFASDDPAMCEEIVRSTSRIMRRVGRAGSAVHDSGPPSSI